MPFIHPQLALAAGAAALIPLVIHLINRRPHRRVQWAAMEFLLAASNRSLWRLRFEHWLLLLVRTLAIVLFGLAVARPVLSGGGLAGWGRSGWHHVLLIDTSLSASLDADSQARPPAVVAAMKLLSAFDPGDAVSVITLASPADAVIGHAAYDRLAVRERVAGLTGTSRSTDLSGALAAAVKVLDESPAVPDNRAVYVISDQAVPVWQADDVAAQTARRLAETVKLVVVPTASGPRNNVAVTALSCADPLPGTQEPVRLVATVANYGQEAVHGVTLQVSLEDHVVRHLSLEPLEPGGQRELAFSVQPTAPGTQIVEARVESLAGDGLAADDVRRLSLEVVEKVPVLLVDGRPGPSKFAGETGYLATAMAPTTGTARGPLLAHKTVTELELPSEVLAGYRLICLCNVPQLGADMWHRLEDYASSGGGILFFSGDAINTDNYNRLGHGLLPAKLGHPTGDAGNREAFVRLDGDTLSHPALADFASADRSGLFLKGRVHRLMPVEPHATATTWLAYTNGLPAVVERSFGSGRVCLVTTSANMAWNNLAARGDYVSLVWSLASYLAGQDGSRRNLIPGDRIIEPISAERVSHSLRVTTPRGRVDDAGLEVADGRYELHYGPVERLGVYTVAMGNRRLRFCVNVDPGESDLAVMDESALRGLLKCPLAYVSDLDRADLLIAGAASAEVAQVCQYLVLLLLVGESWLAMRFANRK